MKPKRTVRKLTRLASLESFWGLKIDGDLWKIAWDAINTRGPGNQALRKVKGHATDYDVQTGVATAEDRDGNNRSDENVDDGVRMVVGRGLVTLGK